MSHTSSSRRRAALAAGSTFLAALLAACRPDSIPSAVVGAPGASQATAAQPVPPPRSNEAHLRALADSIPGFGALYYDESHTLVLALKQGENDQRATGVVRAMIARDRRLQRNNQSNIRIRRVRYGFAELAGWRDRLADNLDTVPGWSMLAISDKDNRVVVGLAADGSPESVRSLLRNVGIPADAVEITRRERATLDAHMSERIRPVQGGISLSKWYSYSDGELCTAGVVGYWHGQAALFTAGHCTEKLWGLDPSPSFMRQGESFYENTFGPELDDRSGYVCGPANKTRCREADVSAYSVANIQVFYGETPYAIGQIARPVERIPASYNRNGDRNLDLNNPLVVVGEGTPYVGETVDRIGNTSGWFYGDVTYLCVDFPIEWNWLGVKKKYVCSTVAETRSQGGDSGGPVFANLDGTHVLFLGINHAHDTPTNAFFASTTQIRRELGSVDFYTPPEPPPPPPPTFYVALGGPTDVEGGSVNTWTAYPYYAANPVDCEWFVDGEWVDGGTCSITLEFDEGCCYQHLIEVEAVDANANISRADRTVYTHTPGGDDMRRSKLFSKGAPDSSAKRFRVIRPGPGRGAALRKPDRP